MIATSSSITARDIATRGVEREVKLADENFVAVFETDAISALALHESSIE